MQCVLVTATSVHGFLDRRCVSYLHINIADEVIAQIITHVHLLHLAVLLLHFREDFLKTRFDVIKKDVAQKKKSAVVCMFEAHLEKLIIMLLHFHIAHGTWEKALY